MLPFALTYLFPSNPLSRFPQGGKAGSFPHGGKVGKGVACIMLPGNINHILFNLSAVILIKKICIIVTLLNFLYYICHIKVI
jgi:hypothetical protein